MGNTNNNKAKNGRKIFVDSNLTSQVNGNTDKPFLKIQNAINYSKENDVIFVKKGIYKENIEINKKVILIGEDKNKTTIKSEKSKDVVQILCDNAKIKGFTIKGGNNGINVKSNNNTIEDNIIADNNHGILIREKEKNKILNNAIYSNTDGILLRYCGYTDIEKNNFYENGIAILFQNSHYNKFRSNEIKRNLFCIELVFSSNNLIDRNIIKENGLKIKNSETISIAASGNNIVVNNKIYGNRFKKIEIARDKKINYINNNEIEGEIKKKYFKNINIFASFSTWFSIGLFLPLIILSLPFTPFNDFKKYIKRLCLYTNNNAFEIKFFNTKKSSKKLPINNLNDNYKTKENKSSYDLIIVCPKEFSYLLTPLAKHKNKHNIKTKIVTLNEIYEGKYFERNGRDKAEKIKYFIKNSIESWNIKFVLLVGNIDKTPMRTVFSAGNDEFLTDLYYADIYDKNNEFCSWDSNNNNFFGKFYHNGNIDEFTLKPDVGIGRIPCRNKNELKIVVKKIIDYENKSKEKVWFKRAILCGGNDLPNYRICEGESICEIVSKLIYDKFDLIKLYDSMNNLNLKNILNEINKGAGIVLLAGRGNEGMWYTFSSDGHRIGKITTIHNILSIKNKRKLPIIFLETCAAGNLNFKNKLFPCFAWSLISNKNGGGIATIASTQMDIKTVEENEITGSALLTIEFFKAFDKNKPLSYILMEAQKNYIKKIGKDYETLVSFNLFGDPSLKIGGY